MLPLRRILGESDEEGDQVVEQLLSEVVGVEELLQFEQLLHLSIPQRRLYTLDHSHYTAHTVSLQQRKGGTGR
jgi:hypothetical protein